MADFRPFDLARAQGAGTRNALAQMQVMGATRSLKDDNAIRRLSQQAAQTGENLPDLLEAEGMPQQAAAFRQSMMDQKIKGMQFLSESSKVVRDQATYDAFRSQAEKMRIANPGELPETYDPKLVEFLSGRAAKDLKLIEVYDPTSPTGTRYADVNKAEGAAGKPPSGMELEFGPDGQLSRISTGRKGGLDKTVTTGVQKKILSVGDTMNSITAIKNRFKPEFQQIGTRWGNFKTAWKSKLNMPISPEEKQALDEYSQYIAEAAQNFSLVLKDMSGVAVNPTEFKRTEAWLPNPGTGIFDGDSPIELEAKIKRFEDFTRRVLAKYNYINANGLSINDVDVDQMPAIIRKRGDVLARKYSQGPAGLSGEDLKRAVRRTLADEFGLVAGP
jgi:hypothetical protein